MLDTFVFISYGILMLAFLAMGALAVRHTARFSYISRQFKMVAWVFGLVAALVVIFSVYLLIKLKGPSTLSAFPAPSTTKINY